MPALAEQNVITLNKYQIDKVSQINGMREKFKLHLEFPNQSPFPKLDSSILQKLLIKGADAIRHELIGSGLTAEETEALTGLKSQPIETQEKKTEESKKAGVIFDADKVDIALLNDIRKIREAKELRGG